MACLTLRWFYLDLLHCHPARQGNGRGFMVFNQSLNTCSLQPAAQGSRTQSPCVMLSVPPAPSPAGGQGCSAPLLLLQPTAVPHCQANAPRTTLHSPGISSPHCFGEQPHFATTPLALLPAPVILYLTAPWWLLRILGEVMVPQLSIQSPAQSPYSSKSWQPGEAEIRKTKALSSSERQQHFSPTIYLGITQEACGRAKSRSRLPWDLITELASPSLDIRACCKKPVDAGNIWATSSSEEVSESRHGTIANPWRASGSQESIFSSLSVGQPMIQDVRNSCLKESFHHFRQLTKPKINISA